MNIDSDSQSNSLTQDRPLSKSFPNYFQNHFEIALTKLIIIFRQPLSLSIDSCRSKSPHKLKASKLSIQIIRLFYRRQIFCALSRLNGSLYQTPDSSRFFIDICLSENRKLLKVTNYNCVCTFFDSIAGFLSLSRRQRTAYIHRHYFKQKLRT